MNAFRRTTSRLASLAILSLGGLVFAIPAQSSKVVDFCSLFEKVPSSTGRVLTKAYLSKSTVSRVDGADDFLYSPACNDQDHFLTLANSKPGVWQKFHGVFDRLPSERANVLEIVFHGSVNVSDSGLFGSLEGWARGEVEVLKILSIRDVTSKKTTINPNWDASDEEVKKIEGLQATIQFFLGNLNADQHSENSTLLTDDFHLTLINKQVLDRTAFLGKQGSYLDTGGIKSIEIRREITFSSPKTIGAVGRLELLSEDRKVTSRYRCDLILTLEDASWKIRRAELTKVTFF